MAKKDTGIIAGFRSFILRGNPMEMAVGIVIGAAFGAIVKTVVDKVINPIIAGLVGKPNFDNVAQFHLGSALVQPGAVITALINFILVAAAVYFIIIVPMNKAHAVADRLAAQKQADEDAEPKPLEPNTQLLTEIRDLLTQNAAAAAGAEATAAKPAEAAGENPRA